MILNEIYLCNQHVEMVHLLHDSNDFLTELSVQTYFTHNYFRKTLYLRSLAGF